MIPSQPVSLETILSTSYKGKSRLVRKIDIEQLRKYPHINLFTESISSKDLLHCFNGFSLNEYIRRLSHKDKIAFLKQVEIVLRALHTKVDTYVQKYIHQVVDRSVRLLQKVQSELSLQGWDANSVHSKIHSLLKAGSIKEKGITRIHGDLGLHSVFFNGEEIVGITDTQRLSFGSPYEDVASMGLELMECGMSIKEIAEVFEEYEQNTLKGYMLLKAVECPSEFKESIARLMS